MKSNGIMKHAHEKSMSFVPHTVFVLPLNAEFLRTSNALSKSQCAYQVSMLYLRQQGTDSAERLRFPFEPKTGFKHGRQWHLKNRRPRNSCYILFFFCTLCLINQPLTLQWCHRRKWKDKTTITSSFVPSLLICKPKRENWKNAHRSRGKMKKVELVVC